MSASEDIVVNPDDLSSVAVMTGIIENPVAGFWLLYLVISVLSIIVYKLGFAKKLPVLKSAIVYFVLFLGCLPLAFFGIAYPVAEGLFVAALVLGIYKFRLHRSKTEA